MDETEYSNLSSSTNAESENEASLSANQIAEVKGIRDCYNKGDDDIGEYYFESDHLALKGNEDYRTLLKTVALLEAQRMKAIKDVDLLIEAKEAALANPIAFVEKLQRKEDLNLPQPQNIINLPSIDWDKYSRNVNVASFTHKHMTRNKKPTAPLPPLSPPPPPPPPPVTDSNSSSSSNEIKTESDDSSVFIRGRISNMGKPHTFNQLWTVEEQKRLEDLLVKYPLEDVEARRWEKIAKALGNRTPQQVASRVQKYFIKLTKIGLPVPGRIPQLNNYGRRLSTHRHQRHNRFLFHPSTFLASREPPVFMSDFDEDSTNYSTTSSMEDDQRWNIDDDKIMDDEFIPPQLHHTDDYQELMYLKRLKKTKEQNKWPNTAQHIGYKCNRCGCEPIIGKRWHCMECPSTSSFDLCDDCSNCNFESSTHVSGHRLESIGEMDSLVDCDYTQLVNGYYNYLDPNYMPAS